jgi:phospholipid/cholesterol/gamma-HCH transport system permease protein
MMSTRLSDTPAQEESTTHDAMEMVTARRVQKPANASLLRVGNAASRVRSIPAQSLATIGRGVALAVAVLRYSVIDTIAHNRQPPSHPPTPREPTLGS